MTPEEKAKELVAKFYYNIATVTNPGSYYDSKQCALIAVNEVLDLISILEINNSYYLQVKQEIEKL